MLGNGAISDYSIDSVTIRQFLYMEFE